MRDLSPPLTLANPEIKESISSAFGTKLCIWNATVSITLVAELKDSASSFTSTRTPLTGNRREEFCNALAASDKELIAFSAYSITQIFYLASKGIEFSLRFQSLRLHRHLRLGICIPPLQHPIPTLWMLVVEEDKGSLQMIYREQFQACHWLSEKSRGMKYREGEFGYDFPCIDSLSEESASSFAVDTFESFLGPITLSSVSESLLTERGLPGAEVASCNSLAAALTSAPPPPAPWFGLGR
nr:hypothetical protein Iba_chr03eCG2470 [Ipomoea batatas]